MAETLHTLLRGSHIVVGTLGLIVYWIAASTKKGGTTHKRAGRLFIYSAYIVGISALTSVFWALFSPASFVHTTESIPQADIDGLRFFLSILGFLGTLLLSGAYLGTRSLRTRSTPEQLGNPLLYVLLGGQIAFSLWLIWTGYYDMQTYGGQKYWICFGLATLGLSDGFQQLRYIRSGAGEHMAWFLKHVECMVGCGAAFHTAALVTITNRMKLSLPGSLALLPWVLPGVLATVVGFMLKRKYQKKFSVGPWAADKMTSSSDGEGNVSS